MRCSWNRLEENQCSGRGVVLPVPPKKRKKEFETEIPRPPSTSEGERQVLHPYALKI